jgi:putative flavoprotein involved in K+ transport
MLPFSDPEYISVVIIGGGQAGLAASYCLRKRGVDDHIIFEKHRIAHSWRAKRWDSFCLVTPNHQCRLPGHPYQGDDPDGFMSKDEVVDYIERFAKSFRPPVLEGINVTSVTKRDGYFHLTTNQGSWYCDDVIVATGGSHIPFVPAGADRIPSHIRQIHSVDYKRPTQIPAGETLIVGSGQSGVQIMEELHLAGRKVHLCLGNAPRSPRRYRGKDAVTWLEEMGEYITPLAGHPGLTNPLATTDPYLTGRDRGHPVDLRQFALEGVKLHGSVEDIDFDKINLRQDLAAKLDSADHAYNDICQRIDDYISANHLEAPGDSHYVPVWIPEIEPAELNFAANNITGIIWCTGFLPDFKFIKLPVFNMRGFPETDRGVTGIPGLYFLGLPWMHTWGSARFSGIAGDADHIASRIEASIPQPARCEP